MPADGVVADHVSEETRDIAQAVCFVAMDSVIVVGKCSLKEIGPEAIDLGESFTDKPVELGVCSFLGTTLDDHRR